LAASGVGGFSSVAGDGSAPVAGRDSTELEGAAGVWTEGVAGFSAAVGLGSVRVGGRVPPGGTGGVLAGGFSDEVGIRSEPDGGSGVVAGREGASPVERRSIAVGGRTGPLGVFA
jgi:hypothetical protein